MVCVIGWTSKVKGRNFMVKHLGLNILCELFKHLLEKKQIYFESKFQCF